MPHCLLCGWSWVYSLLQAMLCCETMMDQSGHENIWLTTLVLTLSLLGCGPNQHSDAMNLKQVIDAIVLAKPTAVTPEQAAEAFALGSDATDLQRDILKKELIGKVVDWEISIYEIEQEEGGYKMISQPIQIKSKRATGLLRVVAHVHPRGDVDLEVLRKSKTNDVIRIRGRVQEVVMRTAVFVGPAYISY